MSSSTKYKLSGWGFSSYVFFSLYKTKAVSFKGLKHIDINLICVKYKEQEMENDLTMEVIDTRYGFDQDKNIFYYSFKKEWNKFIFIK